MAPKNMGMILYLQITVHGRFFLILRVLGTNQFLLLLVMLPLVNLEKIDMTCHYWKYNVVFLGRNIRVYDVEVSS